MTDTTDIDATNPTVADDWLIVTEALEAAGWTGADDNPLEILQKDGATWAISNDCYDSAVSKGGWNVDFPSDTPVSVVIAACLAAVDQPPARQVLGTTTGPPATAPSDDTALRQQLAKALTAEHYRRAQARIVASPEGHSAAMASAVLPVVRAAAAAERDRVLTEAAEVAGQMGGRFGTDEHGDTDAGWNDACEAIATELKQMVNEQLETEAHEHVWTTALDGADQPARDEAGRTWTHCGICGQKQPTPTPTEEQPEGFREWLGRQHVYGTGTGVRPVMTPPKPWVPKRVSLGTPCMPPCRHARNWHTGDDGACTVGECGCTQFRAMTTPAP
ncbi:MAG: hypothetical protein ACRDQ0_05850 [Pseudonocardia sp.]